MWFPVGYKPQAPRGTRQHGALAQELLQSLFTAPAPGVAAGRGPEWRCGSCGVSNFAERHACRACAKRRAVAKPTRPVEPKQPVGKPAVPVETPKRPVAPEARAAEAASQAAALESSAKLLRGAGLAENAELLEKNAAALRKQATLPSPGMRLDQCAAFVDRCKKRCANSEAAVVAAVANRDAAAEELKGAEAQLARLTAELGQLEAADVAPKLCGSPALVPESVAPVVSVLPAAPVDVHSLVAQAMQVASQQMMAQLEGQIVALQSSLSYAFEARLAQLAECNASVPLEEAGQAAVRAQREPRGTDGTAPY